MALDRSCGCATCAYTKSAIFFQIHGRYQRTDGRTERPNTEELSQYQQATYAVRATRPKNGGQSITSAACGRSNKLGCEWLSA